MIIWGSNLEWGFGHKYSNVLRINSKGGFESVAFISHGVLKDLEFNVLIIKEKMQNKDSGVLGYHRRNVHLIMYK